MNSEFVDTHGLYLPNHANLTFKDVDFICKTFLKIAKPIFLINHLMKSKVILKIINSF